MFRAINSIVIYFLICCLWSIYIFYMEQSNNQLRLNSHNEQHQKRISSLLHSYEKIIFCANIWKYNKDSKCQQRILVLTNQSLLNVVKNDNILKSFIKKFVQFEVNYEVKRRINLSALYGITIAPNRNSNVFLIHVINEHDYYYKAIKDKLSLLQMISEEYKKKTKKELPFFLREEVVMLNYCTFKNHLKQRKDLKPKQNPHFLKNDYFMQKEFENLQYICQYSPKEKNTKIVPKNFVRVDVNQLKEGCRYFVLKEEISRSIHLSSFLDEVKILKPQFCFFTEKKQLMFVPFMQGGCFINYIDRYKPLSRQNVIFYLGQIILILEKLQSKNKYLNNLTLQNFYVKNNGYLILDGFQKFEQLKLSEQKPQLTFKISGNPRFFTPQEVTCQGKEKKIDTWRLGLLAYYLWKGEYPFEGKNVKEIYFKILQDQIFQPQLPNFINQLLQKDKRNRLTFQELRYHKDLSEINWKGLQQQQLKAPFVVNIGNWSGKLPIVFRLDV